MDDVLQLTLRLYRPLKMNIKNNLKSQKRKYYKKEII